MKKYHIILGMFCLLAGTACSDDDPVVKGNNGNQTEEECRHCQLKLSPEAVLCG